MKKNLAFSNVYVKESTIANAGRGVFASRDIKKGELIEKCPVIEISACDTAVLNESMLVTYLFYCGENKDQSLVALGYGSIYNHSYKPNAKYNIELEEKAMDFIAIRDMGKDEEITINYKGDSENTDLLWFE